jgi:hypothetical protein
VLAEYGSAAVEAIDQAGGGSTATARDSPITPLRAAMVWAMP